MTSPEERIRELARARGLEASDTEGLLAAVRPVTRKSKNPFDRWSGEATSALGAGLALVALATSRLGIRYDGALDMHVTGSAVPPATALLDQLVAVPLTALVFWAAARLIARGVRFIDILGVVGASRLPLILVAVPIALLTPHLPKDPSRPNAALFAMIALALVGVGVHITLLVLGFRATTAGRGGRLAGAFIGALVGAEVITKIVLALVT